MDLYLILAFVAMFLYGITAIIYKLASKSIDPVSLTLFTSILMTLTIFVFWLFTKQKHITLKGFQYAGVAGIIAGFAFIAFITSIQLGKVSIATTLRGLSFLVTALIAILFLAEKISVAKAIGIGFAAIAILLLTL
ncbi:EamA family transporter [Candidatus Woesearchaeota archaeon]|nr:EamA family transporter [Candidatus Woesearchaeota archaeon]